MVPGPNTQSGPQMLEHFVTVQIDEVGNFKSVLRTVPL